GVTVSLKPVGGAPGDATSEQMRAVADLADRYAFGEIRVSHHQNLILPNVRKDDLHALWQALAAHDLATANVGLVTDIICCPGMDYCSLATARSIPIAQSIAERFAASGREAEIGELNIKISGCINACGHHHVGHIGILGLEKSGAESYQLTLGGDATLNAAVGERLGPGLAAEDVPEAIERIVGVYLRERLPDEAFIDAVRRLGLGPFKVAFQEVVDAVA
ncbi:MAG: nitrite/sulfite reductase, partial [Alsobacter sp.]